MRAPPCFICDTTGSVGERNAYSVCGAPVFMTGAGVVQSASAIGFETLYAGYRWDNTAPQMYYVRNRFLLPQVGTWNKRDPLGYVDGMGLACYVESEPIGKVDPDGTTFGVIQLAPRCLPRPVPQIRIYVPPPELTPPVPILRPIPPVIIVPPKPWPAPTEPAPTSPRDYPSVGPQRKPWLYPNGGKNGTGSDCDEATLRAFDKRIKSACNDVATGTTYPGCSNINSLFWSCDDMEKLKDKWKACANARRERENKCFRGGDRTHQEAIANADYQVSYCYYLLRYWECPGYYFPPIDFWNNA
jgi:RHS repeat-associated protein